MTPRHRTRPFKKRRASTFARRLAAACIGMGLLIVHAPPASAAPRPRPDQWWFPAWEIESKVWPLTKGRDVVIGLLDTGVEARLPELHGVILKGKRFGVGDPGDGRRDEDMEHGGHGTAMAVSIVGQGGGSGLVGVAPEARILPLSGKSVNYTPQIRYAADRGAKVINISTSLPGLACPTDLQKAVAYAIRHDVVIVSSAGNDAHQKSDTFYPGNCAGVLTVGALDVDLNVWEDSSPGSNVVAAAPGASIGAVGKSGVYSKRQGTSYAAAFTSGLVALVRSHFPKMSGREVVQRLLYTARDVGRKGWDERSGYGALIPYSALTAKVPADAPNPVYERFDKLTKTGSPRPVDTGPAAAESEADDQGLPWPVILGVIGLIIAVAAVLGFVFLRPKRPEH